MHVMGQSGLFPHYLLPPLFRFDLRHARLTFLTVTALCFYLETTSIPRKIEFYSHYLNMSDSDRL